jgi:tetratricopeptide (TPR) repeat protein
MGKTEIVRVPLILRIGPHLRTMIVAFCFDLMKVNFDGPTLRLTAEFSVSESMLNQAYHGIEILESHSKYSEGFLKFPESSTVTFVGGDLRTLHHHLLQMDEASKKESKPDILELWVMHERILFQPFANEWRGRLLDHLGDISLQRWKASQMVDYLNQSVYAYQDALRDDPGNTTYLQDLGTALHHRFLQPGDVTDITGAVSSFGQFADLEESIGFYRQALELSPGSHPDRSSPLNNLANALSTRFKQNGDMDDLEESIRSHREILGLFPRSHPNRSISLNNLANALLRRFGHTGQPADLEESITFHQEALELRPGSHPDRSISLNNLGSALLTRFKQTGQLADLEKSIAFH